MKKAQLFLFLLAPATLNAMQTLFSKPLKKRAYVLDNLPHPIFAVPTAAPDIQAEIAEEAENREVERKKPHQKVKKTTSKSKTNKHRAKKALKKELTAPCEGMTPAFVRAAVAELSKNFDPRECDDWRFQTGLERDTNGTTFMHWVCFEGSAALINFYLKKPQLKETINSCLNESGDTFLHFAAAGNNGAAITILLSHGAEVDIKNKLQQTPFFTACIEGNMHAVNRLASAGADVHSLDIESASPLHYASYFGKTEVVRFLLKKGADSNLLSAPNDGHGGSTALLNASLQGHSDIVKLLLEPEARYSKADVSQGNLDGVTALHNACIGGHLAIVRYLLEHGAYIEAVTTHGITPLINACWSDEEKDRFEIGSLLITKGAELNRATSTGETALHCACEMNDFRLVEMLIARGACTFLFNAEKEQPKDLTTDNRIKALFINKTPTKQSPAKRPAALLSEKENHEQSGVKPTRSLDFTHDDQDRETPEIETEDGKKTCTD